MQVVRLSEGSEEPVNSPLFTGTVYRREGEEVAADGAYRASVVRFDHGIRNKFHTHSTDQILVITEGTGTVATENEEFTVTVGDVVITPAGEKHWHGATPETGMAHVTILGSGSVTEQLED